MSMKQKPDYDPANFTENDILECTSVGESPESIAVRSGHKLAFIKRVIREAVVAKDATRTATDPTDSEMRSVEKELMDVLDIVMGHGDRTPTLYNVEEHIRVRLTAIKAAINNE